jgi:hypothetical protein
MDALMYLRLQYFGWPRSSTHIVPARATGQRVMLTHFFAGTGVELLGFITLMTMLIIIPVNISVRSVDFSVLVLATAKPRTLHQRNVICL